MKRTLTLTLAVCLSAAAVYGEVRGAWTASPHEKRPDELQLNLVSAEKAQRAAAICVGCCGPSCRTRPRKCRVARKAMQAVAVIWKRCGGMRWRSR